MAHIIRLALALYLLLSSSALFAHHGVFYKEVFAAIETTDLEDIKDRFSRSAWDGKQGAMSAAELQERLKTASVRGLFENSLHDEQRSKCLVAFKLEYPDQTVERIWLLAEDFDPRFRQWDWRIVRIVNEEGQAQAFFKHSYSAEFSAGGMEGAEATEPAVPSNQSSRSGTVPDPGVGGEEIVSGPQVGEPVTGFFDNDGEKRGGLKDDYPIGTVMRYYCEFRGLVVLVFARTFDDEMASLVKEIDKVIGNNPRAIARRKLMRILPLATLASDEIGPFPEC